MLKYTYPNQICTKRWVDWRFVLCFMMDFLFDSSVLLPEIELYRRSKVFPNYFAIFALKNAKINGILPPEAIQGCRCRMNFKRKCKNQWDFAAGGDTGLPL